MEEELIKLEAYIRKEMKLAHIETYKSRKTFSDDFVELTIYRNPFEHPCIKLVNIELTRFTVYDIPFPGTLDNYIEIDKILRNG